MLKCTCVLLKRVAILQKSAQRYKKKLIFANFFAVLHEICIFFHKMEQKEHIVDQILRDRLDLMRRLDTESDSDYRRHVARETATLHAPLAHRLGLYTIKTELEDLSLKHQDYATYRSIADALAAKKGERDAYVQAFIEPIEQKLKREGFEFTVKGRPKSISSIYHKMKMQHCGVDGIYDLFAIRIILDAPPDDHDEEKRQCWQVYSIITDMYQPNPKRLRDWLSAPKPNGYESLHTTVLGPNDKWVEVQIRTRRMDSVAEQGEAAHWAYKGVNGKALGTGRNYVYVFTPMGDLRRLHEGATVLDFAFSIHSDIGLHCIGAKIGGHFVKIRNQVEDGDVIEILTAPHQKPTEDWINYVYAHRSKSKIRQALRKEGKL